MSYFSSTSTLLVVIFVCPNLLRMVNAGDKDKGHTIIVKSGENDRYGYHHPHIIPIPVPVPIHHHGHHGFFRRSGHLNPPGTSSNSDSNGEASQVNANYSPSPYVTPFGAGLPLPLTSWLSQSLMSNPFMSQSMMSPSSIYQLMFGGSQHITHRVDAPTSMESVDGKASSNNHASESNESTRNGDVNSNEVVPVPVPVKPQLNLTPGVLHPVFTPDYSSMFTPPANAANNGFMWKFTPVSESNDYWTR